MPLTKLDVNWALTASLPKPDFVLPGLMPGTFGLLVAPGGTGKSMLALDILISLASGTSAAAGLFPSQPAAKVVFLAAEESKCMLAHRLRSMVLDQPLNDNLLNNLVLLPMAGELCLLINKNGKSTNLFHELVEISAGARLIIVDPLRRTHSSDENSSSEMTRLVVALEQLAKRTGAAVIGLHHANRSNQESGSQNISRGSSALVDGCRWQINLTKMDEKSAQARSIPETDRHLYVSVDFAKANYLPPQKRIWLKRQPSGRFVVDIQPYDAPAKLKKTNPINSTSL